MNVFARSPAKQHGWTRRICGKWYWVFDRSVHLSMAEVPSLDKLKIVTRLSRLKGLAPITNVVSPPLDHSAGYLLSYNVWTLINIIWFEQGICSPRKDCGGRCHFCAFGLFQVLQCFQNLIYLFQFNMCNSHFKWKVFCHDAFIFWTCFVFSTRLWGHYLNYILFG